MKTYNDLFPAIYDFESLYRAYIRARRGKRHLPEVQRFEANLEGELIQLQNELIWGQYRTGAYHTFYVHEPKKRLVAALPFRDRVVQHSLIAQMEPIWEARFIHHSYACRQGKGTHAGADQAQKWLRAVKREYGRVYALKADVLKYFASIDHDALLALLRRRIACKYTMSLLEDIVGTWAPGLPIGNLTSQLCANVYLDAFDQHVKQELRVKRYMRYMDDWLIVHHDKAVLHTLRRYLEGWLFDNLKLRLNNKTQIFPVGTRHGRALDFLGYRIWTTHRKLRKDSAGRIRRTIKRLQHGYARGDVDLAKIRQHLMSWKAHADRADSYRLRKQIFDGAVFSRQGDNIWPHR